MQPRRTLAGYGIATYRCRLALSNDEWAKLKGEAARMGLKGERLIERILQDVCAALPAPSPDPLPDDPGPDETEDMVQIV